MKTSRAAVSLLACSVVLFSADASRAQSPGVSTSSVRGTPDDARARFERGAQLFSEGAYDAALLEFRRAHELDSGKFQVLYNIAQVYYQLNDYAEALRSFEDYLAKGGGQVPPERLVDVKKEVEKLRLRVARVDIRSNVEGTEISVDDVSLGKTPFQRPVVLNAGRRRISAMASGYLPLAKVVEVAGADSIAVNLELQKADNRSSSTAEPAPGGSQPAAPAGESRSIPWIGWGITGALAASAVVTGIVAMSASSTLKDQQNSLTATKGDLDDSSGRVRGFGIASDILTAGALIAGGTSLYFTLANNSSTKEAPSVQPARIPAVRIVASPMGAFVTGSF